MEPLSQAALGALGAHLKARKLDLRKATLFGALGGLAPDLDYFIRTSHDPLFTLEFHRQFSHSLIFIPIGALIVSLFLRIFKVPLKESYSFVLLGYATHGLLDSCTSYGTQLLWPFSTLRVAWSNIAVLDPLFTIPVVTLIILAYIKRKKVFSNLAWLFALSYLGFGFVQKSRVENQLIKNNKIDDKITRKIIKPTLGNNFLWRVILERGDTFEVLGVRLFLFKEAKLYNGEMVKKYKISEVKEYTDSSSVQRNDFERFKFFTEDFLFWYGPGNLADIRYSLLPNSTKPIWYIRFIKDNPDSHIEYILDRKPSPEQRQKLIQMLKGN